MESAHALALGLLGLGLGSAILTRGQERRPDVPIVRRADLERDLKLVARIEGTTPAYSWWPLSIAVRMPIAGTMRNRVSSES